MNNQQKIVIGIVILIIVGIFSVYYWYLPMQKRTNEVNTYKKALYYGVLCEYNCPLEMQDIKNRTQLLPQAKCVKNCTKEFIEEFKNVNYTREELDKDGIMSTMTNFAIQCKQDATDVKKMAINNSQFFICYAEELEKLKEKYKYLN